MPHCVRAQKLRTLDQQRRARGREIHTTGMGVVMEDETLLKSSRESSPGAFSIAVPSAKNKRSGASSSASSANASSSQAHGGASWFDASFIILGEILGTGVLGMPKAVTILGLWPGVGCIALFGVLGLYSALLVSRTRRLLLQRPDGPVDVHSFGQAAKVIVGPNFGTFTRYAVLLNWLLILPYYVMAASKSIMLAVSTLWGVDLCYYTASALVCVGLFPMMQVQSLARLKGLALGSTIAIVVVLLLIVYYVYSQRQDVAVLLNGTVARALSSSSSSPESVDKTLPATATRLLTTSTSELDGDDWDNGDGNGDGGSIVEIVNSMSNIMFAYQGHSMFLEVIAEMKRPDRFARSAYFSNAVMLSVYAGISILVIWQVSDAAVSLLTHARSVMPSNVLLLLLSLLLLLWWWWRRRRWWWWCAVFCSMGLLS